MFSSRRTKLGRAKRSKSRYFESLEVRSLLTASSATSIIMQPEMMRFSAAASNSASSAPTGLTPQQVSQAYGFNQIQFGTATSRVSGDGTGETIAIVDAYDDPNVQQDLTTFDTKFGLAAPPSFTEQFVGGARPQGNSGWSEEISLDVEWAHAMAPKANLVLVEAQSASLSSLLSAVDLARNLPTVNVISMSWGSNEFSGETSYDSHFTTPSGHIGITFVASSGDSGAPGVWPALSPNVLAVGGTTLHLSSSGGYGSESAWSDSGGGVSQYESEPAYQQSAQSTGARTSPDVAYNANPSTGYSVYDSYSGDDWFTVGGTSAGAPQWSALIAIADQGRGSAGSLANAQADIYNLPSTDFHDVTGGSNGYQAGTGYDLVTGLGSPLANLVAEGLAGATAAPSPTPTPNPTPTPTPTPSLTAPTVTASAASTTVASLSWNLVSGAQGYKVYLVVNGQDQYLGAVGATTSSVQVTGLTAGSTDSFMVAAYNATSTAASSVVNVTLPTPAVPSSVTAPIVTATVASSTSVVLNWNAESQATGYNIYWSNGYRTQFLGTVNGSTTSVTITGLSPGSASYFLVQAFNTVSYANSQWTAVVTPFASVGSTGSPFQYAEQRSENAFGSVAPAVVANTSGNYWNRGR
ncbi:MAG TPA: fibronectin type III domain-containing protein [Pirellulales bacterium]|nr:fibronectin type III domain-containing protein [Pirellulales bacterium]